MFKLDLQKAKETEIKLPTSDGSLKKQESSRKTSTSALLTYSKALDCVNHHKVWKILKEMGIRDQLTCLLRNLYAGQEVIVISGYGTTNWFQIRKGACQFSSVAQSCPTLCEPMNCSMPGLPVHHQLPESTQTHVH